ncbi:hypothetical protein F1654_04575 [Alkalicaulis satelles]|uniref:Host specificity protein n=1 Tax=Alkalicaulis satelles TaxID=2609175 RepID=A0A5M6ZKB9_9PROT|nr:glycoside hydrolase/phage tail family protein [Alkalicaulis satelles]KAA5805259.1 hypothetical protein F1654_04575 [Alkalicaulis satelles]
MGQVILPGAARLAAAFIGGAAQRAITGLFARDREGPRLSELSVQTSTEGAGIPIVYGRMRVTGQVIWAARFRESAQTRSSGGGKGGPKTTEYRYSLSFAVGLAEGPIGGVGRIWANGEPFERAGALVRIYTGAEDQAPDPLITAIEGAAPAYRGLAYAVFEDLDLTPYGERIPNLSFEIIAAAEGEAGGLEEAVRGMCLIPASGEFAYADRAVAREIREGQDRPENRHTARAGSDLEAALDDLARALPNCQSVALVTAWFGTDLRCAECEIRPGVETREKVTRPLIWSAAGETRATAHLVSGSGEGPAYGGAPGDETVIMAIKALKARGYQVTLYPFILMDVAPGNGLPDPWGGAEQGAYPWRGRITCHPAPGQPGSPDQSAVAADQVSAFHGGALASHFSVSGETIAYSGPDAWSFSRFILHHGSLAKAAGGVESLIIGSEMRSLTQVRSGPADYPFVSHLKHLAGEARALLGPQVKLSYAADWSEYFGHAPGGGDRLFHLDPLWADENIDYVGIDWYAPLADWREGAAHLDALAGAASIYDRDYLSANVEGGEGYDWFYASPADREAQARTPITDGAHDEPWVWRYKDLRRWWANAHHERLDGVRNASPTDWVPAMKPVRLVELGCPAVDKGANQPNVFIDPKSSESFAPYFSTGARDDLIQRRYIEALYAYWTAPGVNPLSPVYGGPMLDMAMSHVWTWDARPFPEFPARSDVWADGPNWRTGHWLTGRAGQSPLARLVSDIAARAGLAELDASRLTGVLAGFVIEPPVRARDLIDQLGAAFGFVLADRADGPACIPVTPEGAPLALEGLNLAVRGDGERVSFSRAPEEARPEGARLTFLADDGDYRPASVYAHGLDSVREGLIDLRIPALADRTLAAGWAQTLLTRARAEAETARLVLPPSLSALEPGDAVTLDAGPAGRVWRIAVTEGLSARRAELTGASPGPALITGPEPGAGEAAALPSRPLLRALDLPLAPGEGARGGLWAAASADPWPGELVIYAGASLETASERARITAPAFTGVLTAPLGPGFEGRIDKGNVMELRLDNGALSSVTRAALLSGANRLAVETGEGWEVLSFETAEMTGPQDWRLTGLLRGMGGSPLSGAGEGARVVVLDGAGAVVPVSAGERGEALILAAVPPGAALNDPSARVIEAGYHGADIRPLSPVHVRAHVRNGALEARWVRRGRLDADAWGADIPLGEESERYAVSLLNADETVVWQGETAVPALSLEAGVIASVLPGGTEGARLRVAQISAVYGPGRAGEIALAP